ncbi:MULTISPECIES: hypothetical protein [unclassified Mycobacteroides]|uniref:hypothetical protein n=1 Tax=unclassified Mycobacteroides TaxID=2618759 RepID=UPI0012DEF503|nr:MULTISPECIES: hypothetical protein [unclassified Mycobacteroides]
MIREEAAMSDADIASVLAVGAAACVAFGDVIHQCTAHAVPAQDIGSSAQKVG